MKNKRKAILLVGALLCLNLNIFSQNIPLKMNKVSVKKGLSGNFWLVIFKIRYLCLPLFYETRTTPSCHPSGCAYRQL